MLLLPCRARVAGNTKIIMMEALNKLLERAKGHSSSSKSKNHCSKRSHPTMCSILCGVTWRCCRGRCRGPHFRAGGYSYQCDADCDDSSNSRGEDLEAELIKIDVNLGTESRKLHFI